MGRASASYEAGTHARTVPLRTAMLNSTLTKSSAVAEVAERRRTHGVVGNFAKLLKVM